MAGNIGRVTIAEGVPMSATITITLTAAGVAVAAGAETARFREIEDAVRFARARLERVQHVRDLSARCE